MSTKKKIVWSAHDLRCLRAAFASLLEAEQLVNSAETALDDTTPEVSTFGGQSAQDVVRQALNGIESGLTVLQQVFAALGEPETTPKPVSKEPLQPVRKPLRVALAPAAIDLRGVL